MKTIIISIALCFLSQPCWAANELETLQDLSQTEFHSLSQDLGAALSYQALIPGEPLGLTGFDLGVGLSATAIENEVALDKASGGDSAQTLPVSSLRGHKGLPGGLDVGGFIARVPNSKVQLIGVELRYALLDGGMSSPSLSLRGSYTQLSGVEQLAWRSSGLDLSIAKSLPLITPYAGVGRVWVTSNPAAATGLEQEKFSLGKYFVGADLQLGPGHLLLEVGRTGDATTLGLKLGIRY